MYKTATINTVNALKAALEKKLPMKAEDVKRLRKKLRFLQKFQMKSMLTMSRLKK